MRGVRKMDTKKFLQQVYGELVRNEIENVKLRETCIEIFKDENVVFKISGKGEMFYSADKQFRDFVDKLHEKIQPIVWVFTDSERYGNAHRPNLGLCGGVSI